MNEDYNLCNGNCGNVQNTAWMIFLYSNECSRASWGKCTVNMLMNLPEVVHIGIIGLFKNCFSLSKRVQFMLLIETVVYQVQRRGSLGRGSFGLRFS